MTPECKAKIQAALEPFAGWRFWHLDELVSTQDSLREAFEGGEREHLVLSAGVQRGGRGRHGRRWDQEPEQDLALSVLLTPLDRYPPLLLPFLFPAVLYETLKTIGIPPDRLRIKWPNDLLLGEKKIAGVLIEGEGSGTFLCGLGCNVGRQSFPEELQGIASSLALEGMTGVSYPELLEILLVEMAQRVMEAEQGKWAQVLRAYKEGFRWMGKEVILETKEGKVSGKLEEIGPEGMRLSNASPLDLGEVLAVENPSWVFG